MLSMHGFCDTPFLLVLRHAKTIACGWPICMSVKCCLSVKVDAESQNLACSYLKTFDKIFNSRPTAFPVYLFLSLQHDSATNPVRTFFKLVDTWHCSDPQHACSRSASIWLCHVTTHLSARHVTFWQGIEGTSILFLQMRFQEEDSHHRQSALEKTEGKLLWNTDSVQCIYCCALVSMRYAVLNILSTHMNQSI